MLYFRDENQRSSGFLLVITLPTMTLASGAARWVRPFAALSSKQVDLRSPKLSLTNPSSVKKWADGAICATFKLSVLADILQPWQKKSSNFESQLSYF